MGEFTNAVWETLHRFRHVLYIAGGCVVVLLALLSMDANQTFIFRNSETTVLHHGQGHKGEGDGGRSSIDDPFWAGLPDRLLKATHEAEMAMVNILNTWDHRQYPKILETCFHIPEKSWEIIRSKIVARILAPHSSWVMSFMGSSVTAGHDNWFNQSYPVVLGQVMQSTFSALGVKLVVRNQAIGNNPCEPYDYCVDTFAGLDADFISWEQTMNCPDGYRFTESFARQGRFLPNKPATMFTDSDQLHWHPDTCKDVDPGTTTPYDEVELLKLVRETKWSKLAHSRGTLSNAEFAGGNGRVDMEKNYIGMAPHMPDWNCLSAYDIKCKAPFGPDFSWTEFAAVRWHPGVKTHKFRAHAQALYYLQIVKEAVDFVRFHMPGEFKTETVAALKHLHFSVEHYLREWETHVHESPLSCDWRCETKAKCFTDFMPHIENGFDRVLVGETRWKLGINFADLGWVSESQRRGYQDRKWLYEGDRHSGPISFIINPETPNPVWICHPPGDFGRYPPEQVSLLVSVRVFVESGVSRHSFTSPKEPRGVEFPMEDLGQCFAINGLKPGSHILTLWPKPEAFASDDQKVLVAWLVYW